VASRVGTRRDLVWARLPLGEVRRVARAEGVTVNDVVLALTAGALAEHLVEPGDGPAPRDPRAVVPVSTHSSNPADEVRNRFAVVVVDLPVGLGDPRARLRRIHADLVERKAGVPGSLGARVFGLAGLVPPRFLRAPGRLALDHQPLADLAVTNMPGPRDALHLLGARMLEVYPMVCGVGNLAIILGVLSYEDALGVCITVDADVVPDPDDLLRGFVEGFDALVEAVDGGGRAPAPGR
jgi:WS/DGAT/MGAT family acyltransferase